MPFAESDPQEVFVSVGIYLVPIIGSCLRDEREGHADLDSVAEHFGLANIMAIVLHRNQPG